MTPQAGGSHLENGNFHYYKTSEVTIVPRDSEDTFNIDGEVGRGVSTHIRVLPSAIRVFVAADT